MPSTNPTCTEVSEAVVETVDPFRIRSPPQMLRSKERAELGKSVDEPWNNGMSWLNAWEVSPAKQLGCWRSSASLCANLHEAPFLQPREPRTNKHLRVFTHWTFDALKLPAS